MKNNFALLERNDSFVQFMQTMLERMGFGLTLFRSLAELVEAVPEKFDIIFIGDMIEDATTMEAIERIKSMTAPENRIVVVSIVSNKETVNEMFKSGIDDYILKPIHPRELYWAIVENFEHQAGKRFNLRAAVDLEAALTCGGERRIVQVKSLSSGGALVEAGFPLEEGGRVDLELPLSQVSGPQQGTVIYCERQGPDGRYDNAVRFEEISERDRSAIDAYLETRLLVAAWEEMPVIPENILSLGPLLKELTNGSS